MPVVTATSFTCLSTLIFATPEKGTREYYEFADANLLEFQGDSTIEKVRQLTELADECGVEPTKAAFRKFALDTYTNGCPSYRIINRNGFWGFALTFWQTDCSQDELCRWVDGIKWLV